LAGFTDMNTTKTIRSRSIRIEDPASMFVDWKYRIDKHHYESLGLVYRQFVKDKRPYFAWAQMNPIEYIFETGYLFYENNDSSKFLQVAADWDAFRIEVHAGILTMQKSRQAYAVTAQEFAEWLKTGAIPPEAKLLDFSSSKAGLMAWEIARDPFVI